MATTTNYSWTTPDDTALVKDGAAAIRSLGTAIDTTTFNNASAAIAKTIVDAKGDIIVATAADTVSRLAVGANDTVLVADSAQATGVKWATPASGGMTLISTTTLTGASVTISSIPATYYNLQLVIRNYKPATDNEALMIRINADSAANRHGITTTYGGSQNATFGVTEAQTTLGNDNSVANGLIILDIYDYANAVTWKYWQSQSLNVNNTTTTNADVYRNHGRYNQTGAISSLQLFPQVGNFTSGTALLYGVK